METKKQEELTPITNKIKLDGEIERAFMKFLGSHAPIQKFEEGTPKELTEYLDQLYINMNDHWPANAQIRRQNFETKAADQSEVKMRWYTPEDIAAESPAVVFIHGGGHVAGSVDLYDRVVANYVQRSNVPFLSVEYGLSPQTNGKIQAEQAFEAIIWLRENAGQLGINKDRIAIMGDSAGGGIAAAAAILARDRKIHIARQILIYPMLDYRNTIPDENIEPYTMVGYQVIKTAWDAVISPDHLSGHDLMIASPALLDKFEDLAPIYISVGDLDYFKVENLKYARKAAEAGVPLEFHLHPGAPHGFELFSPEAPVAERATADHINAIKSF